MAGDSAGAGLDRVGAWARGSLGIPVDRAGDRAESLRSAGRGGMHGNIAARTGVRQFTHSVRGSPYNSPLTNRLDRRICLVTGSTGIAAAAARALRRGRRVGVRRVADEEHCRDARRTDLGPAAGERPALPADLTDDARCRRRRSPPASPVRTDRRLVLRRRRQRPAVRRRADPRDHERSAGTRPSRSTCAARR